MQKTLADRLGPARVPFLLLPPVCVLLGFAVARFEGSPLNLFHLILAMVGAVASHISVNAFNEYADFRSGLDEKTTRTPFSGGSGTLQRRPELAGWALTLAIGSLVFTAAIGIYFAVTVGWGILPVGAAGVLIILSYSVWAVRRPLICLLVPGLGFGTCMVIGSHYVLAGHFSWAAAAVSLIPFFLVSNLLLLNQFPDVEADASVGRKNLVIAAGRKAAAVVYALFMIGAYASLLAGVLLAKLPLLSLIGLATLAVAVPAVVAAFRHGDDIPRLIPALGMNVVTNLAIPLLVAVGIMLG